MLAQTNVEVMGGIQFSFSPPGARSLALGGAFLGLADDATAAFSNPAGLTHFTRMETSLEFRRSLFTHEFTDLGHAFEDPTGIGVDTVSGLRTDSNTSKVTGLSFLSFVYPRKRWAMAVYRHELANFETQIATQGPFVRISDLDLTTRLFPVIGSLQLKIVTYGVSGAFSISDQFSIGLGLAYSEFGMNSLTQRFNVPFPDPSNPNTDPGGDFGPPDFSDSNLSLFEEQFGDDHDMTFNFGFLWSITDHWSLGGVYRKGPTFDLATVAATTGGLSEEQSARFAVPDVFGLGVAFRPIDAITISFDYDRVEYSRLTEQTTAVLLSACESSISADDADEFHLGFEYVFRARYPTAIRVGVWRDPDHKVAFAGSVDSLCDQIESILFPDGDDSLHYTAGLGLILGKHFQIDAAMDRSDLLDIFSVSGVVRF